MIVFKSRKQTSSPSSKYSDSENKTRFLKLLQHLQLPSYSWITDLLHLNPAARCLQ